MLLGTKKRQTKTEKGGLSEGLERITNVDLKKGSQWGLGQKNKLDQNAWHFDPFCIFQIIINHHKSS